MENKPTISQTLIKQFEKEEYCPKKIKALYIDKTHQFQTLAMLSGSYFETAIIGSCADGTQVLDLPRKKNGDTTIDHARIDMQIRNFPQTLRKYGIKMPVPKAKQVVITHTILDWPTRIVIDFNSSINHPEYGNYPVAIFDVKLTKDKDNTFGDFAWGIPEEMDHIQAHLYSWVLKERFKTNLPKGYNIPFFYLIFDYKPEYGHKLVPVYCGDDTHEQLLERVKLCINKIIDANKSNWEARPSFPHCDKCPLQKDRTCQAACSITIPGEVEKEQQQNKPSFFDSL